MQNQVEIEKYIHYGFSIPQSKALEILREIYHCEGKQWETIPHASITEMIKAISRYTWTQDIQYVKLSHDIKVAIVPRSVVYRLDYEPAMSSEWLAIMKPRSDDEWVHHSNFNAYAKRFDLVATEQIVTETFL